MFYPLLAAAMVTTGAPVAVTTLPNRPVESLDLDRYAGHWHEIAHLPMFFQRKCIDKITATYIPNPDGTIGVHNACRTEKGEMDASDGVAKPVDGVPGALKVRFAPAWLSWVPGVWADYWVIEVGHNYQWAVVGSPSHKYLWVLSRSPSMDRGTFEQIRERAAQRGYPVNDLVMAAPLD